MNKNVFENFEGTRTRFSEELMKKKYNFFKKYLFIFFVLFSSGFAFCQEQVSSNLYNFDQKVYEIVRNFELSGNLENAYIFLKANLNENETAEKKFFILYKLGQIVEKLKLKNPKYSWEEAKGWYIRAHSVLPSRVEPLVRIAVYYFRGITEEEQKNILLKDRMQLTFDFAVWAMKSPCYPDNLLPDEDKGLCEIEALNIAAPAASYIGECEKGKLFTEKLLNKFPNNEHLKQNLNWYKSGQCFKEDYLAEAREFIGDFFELNSQKNNVDNEILEKSVVDKDLLFNIYKKIDSQNMVGSQSNSLKIDNNDKIDLVETSEKNKKDLSKIVNDNFEKSFVVIIMSYNNKDWYKRNLDSVFSQKYMNYRIIYVDDFSSDETGNLVEDYIKEKKQENKVTLIKNSERVGAAANIYKVVNNYCKSDEIVVQLDGDDWFYGNDVLSYLNNVYKDSNTWLTYGQFSYWLGDDKALVEGWAAQIPDDVIVNGTFRKYLWKTTALRTFYAGLFKKIRREDLLYNIELVSKFLLKDSLTGGFYKNKNELPIYKSEFLPVAHDVAIMFPMLEMARERTKFISKVLYIYNIDTPGNDMKKDKEFQEFINRYIRSLKKYDRIENFLS